MRDFLTYYILRLVWGVLPAIVRARTVVAYYGANVHPAQLAAVAQSTIPRASVWDYILLSYRLSDWTHRIDRRKVASR